LEEVVEDDGQPEELENVGEAGDRRQVLQVPDQLQFKLYINWPMGRGTSGPWPIGRGTSGPWPITVQTFLWPIETGTSGLWPITVQTLLPTDQKRQILQVPDQSQFNIVNNRPTERYFRFLTNLYY
jgi:hypothetical protein